MAATTKRTPRKAAKKRAAKKAPAKKAAAKRTSARKSTKMSVAHKKALASGRTEASAIRGYLDALEAHKPKRGRKVSADDLRNRIDNLTEKAGGAKASQKLLIVQERLNLEQRLEEVEDNSFDITDLQEGFIRYALGYAERKHISYSAFREIGVPAAVLQEAGITRSM